MSTTPILQTHEHVHNVQVQRWSTGRVLLTMYPAELKYRNVCN